MKLFTRLAAMLAASSLLLAPVAALAQAGPGAVIITQTAQPPTYSATKVALAPAASATDFFTITGAAGRVVQVRSIHCDGISTANAAAMIQVIKRSAVDTGGTSTTTAAVANNSAFRAPLATVRSYTVNPAGLGAAVGTPIVTSQLVTGPAASATIANVGFTHVFAQVPVLRSATEVLALNANAATFTAGAAINCSITWSE